MRRSWLTAASALAAIATDSPEASAQLFTAPSEVDFADTLVGSTSSEEFSVVVRETITSGDIFAAAAPFSGGPVSLGTTKAQVFATYNFAPTITGTATDFIRRKRGKSGCEDRAERNHSSERPRCSSVEISTGSAPVARIGTSSLQTVTVSNTGDGNLSGLGDSSDLHGSLGASTGVFAGSGGSFDLADSSQTSFDYTFTPVAHGTATATVTANFLTAVRMGRTRLPVRMSRSPARASAPNTPAARRPEAWSTWERSTSGEPARATSRSATSRRIRPPLLRP